MGIAREQLSWNVEGHIVYTSYDYGMDTLDLPSADSVSMMTLLKEGRGWGQSRADMTGRDEVEFVVNVPVIEKDLGAAYPDQRGIQYLRYGGVANAKIELRNVLVKENHKMTEDGRAKARKNILKDVAAGHIVTRNKSFPFVREHNIGAIAKSRKDRQLLAQHLACRWRVIDDVSGEDSVNEATGSHGSLELAQGVRIAEVCRKVVTTVKLRGLDPRGIVGLKVDIASAYRNFKVTKSDRWLFGFMFEGINYLHTSWPFGAVASVYNFLRIPLMIVYYLAVTSWWYDAGVMAAMYFDDLSVIGHEEDIPKAGQETLDLFDRWGIPRQEDKWLEENQNGLQGSHVLTIMGLKYNFREMTVGIPPQRLRDILEEILSFSKQASMVAKPLKKWESVIGIMSWASIVIPQLRPLLTGTWYFKRVWENQGGGRGVRKMSRELCEDWEQFVALANKWSGTSAIFREKLVPASKSGYSSNRIDPAADASGTLGWGIVSEFGYAKGRWSDKEAQLPIHLKEGLALYMLIALVGDKLGKTEFRIMLRSDNQGLVKSLKRGRAKDRRLNVIVQLISSELLKHDIVLRVWKTRGKRIADVQFIGTKENVLADALSRFDMETFNKITNNLPFNLVELQIQNRITVDWTRAVEEMMKYT